MSDRKQGVCKWFDAAKGYGFVSAEGKDYFVHFRSIAGTGYKLLDEGQEVSFLVKSGEKGLIADDVIILSQSGLI